MILLSQAMHAHEYGILQNHWFLAYLGWAIYNLYLAEKARHDFDTEGDGYDWKEFKSYAKANLISIIISFLLVLVGVPNAEWLWDVLTPAGTKFAGIAYFGVGMMSIIFQMGIKYLTDKLRK